MPDAARATAVRIPPARLGALRIGVLHNPSSGANRKAPALMQRVFAAHPEVPRCSTTGPGKVAPALAELARAGVNTLAVSGGDGTLQAALNVLASAASPFRAPPRLAVLRAGTTNMTAGDVGLAGRPDRALTRLIAGAVRGGQGLGGVQRHVLRIEPGDGAPIFGMYFGTAAIVTGVEYCTRKVHRVGLRGQIGPGITLARFALAMARGHSKLVPPVRLGVAIDGGESTAFACWIAQVTTLERLFLGLRPFWGAEAAPLHYTSVTANPRYWLRALPALLRGRPGRLATPANGYASHNVRQIEFRLDGRFLVDGELFASTPGSPIMVRDGGAMDFIVLQP